LESGVGVGEILCGFVEVAEHEVGVLEPGEGVEVFATFGNMQALYDAEG
jgi:hypothetical protein